MVLDAQESPGLAIGVEVVLCEEVRMLLSASMLPRAGSEVMVELVKYHRGFEEALPI